MDNSEKKRLLSFPTTTVLPVLVLIDMFAVSLVVPLLLEYYKAAGVHSAQEREWLSSLFSASQIVGGLLLGFLTDAHILHQRTLLLLSFIGSAIAYILLAYGNGIYSLIISRVTIGLVKQTLTVSTAILAQCCGAGQERARHVGHVTAATTAAWMVGPSVGGWLYHTVHPNTPVLLSAGLFVVNTVIAVTVWEDDEKDDPAPTGKLDKKKKGSSFFLHNVQLCFSSPTLGCVVLSRLLVTWMAKATNPRQINNYYESIYGMEAYQRGYLSSYNQLIQFLVQWKLVSMVLHWTKGERRAIVCGAVLLALAAGLESLTLPYISPSTALLVFLALWGPLFSLCTAMCNLSLSTLLTHVTPHQSIFSVLAALDVLQNAVSISAPFYRTILFRVAGSMDSEGDPDPMAWVQLTAVHWGLAAMVVASLLLVISSETEQEKHKDEKTKKRN